MKNCVNYIQSGIEFDCKEHAKKGVENRGWIVPFDWVNVDGSDVENGICKGLVLNESAVTGNTKFLFPIEIPGNTPFNGLKKTLVVGTYQNTWTSEVPIIILNTGPKVVKNVIEPLTSGTKYIMIVENRYKPGTSQEGAFEIFGWENGLVASAGENDKYSDDTLGGWSVTLQETEATAAALYFAPVVQEGSGVSVTRKYIEDHEYAAAAGA